MKYFFKTFFFFIGPFLFGHGVEAQDLSQDLLKVQAAYTQIESYHGKVKSKIYSEKEAKIPSQQQQMEIWKKASMSLSKMEGAQILLNKDYLISINSERDVINCKLNQLGPEGIPAIELTEINSLLERADEVVYKGITKGDKCYVLKLSHPVIDVIELYIDAQSYLPTREVRHYVEGSGIAWTRSEMEFEHIAVDKPIPDHYFSEKQFITVTKEGKVQTADKYKNYHLILGDQLSYATSFTQ